jgi:hypothetical protein
MICPRCQGAFAASDVGQGVGRCIDCGAFVCTPDARRKLCRFLKVDEVIWTSLLSSGGRGAPCPMCPARMSLVNLKGVTVDGCGGCGALLLDPGELMRLTGRDEGPPIASSPGPTAPSMSVASTHGPGLGRVHQPPGQALRGFLERAPWVQLRQERPQLVAGGLVAIDFGTRYAVNTPEGAGMLMRQEGAAAMVARIFLTPLVTQRFTLRDPRENPMLVLDRRFEKLVLSRLDVALDDAGDPGPRLGSVERNLRVVDTRYELKDARGAVFARLVRPTLSLWQFRLETAAGTPSGAVAKQWSGFATEFFSDADDFGVDFGATRWTIEQRAVITAAALAIDLDHFERGNQGLSGRTLLDLLD